MRTEKSLNPQIYDTNTAELYSNTFYSKIWVNREQRDFKFEYYHTVQASFINKKYSLLQSCCSLKLKQYCMYVNVLKTRLKITQLKKMRFIKVSELKLTQVEFFHFFTLCALLLMHLNCFVWPIQQILKAFCLLFIK